MRGPLGATRQICGPLGITPASTAVAWYLSGGITPLAAYQPKGASDAVTARSNLVTPGTYDAYLGTAPTWDTLAGWTGNGSSMYLKTDIIPVNNQTWSAAVQASGVNTAVLAFLFGMTPDTLVGFGLMPGANGIFSLNGGRVKYSVSGTISGNFMIVGNKFYKDGVDTGVTIPTGTVTMNKVYILAPGPGTPGSLFSSATISSFVVANALFTAPVALAAAMAAL